MNPTLVLFGSVFSIFFANLVWAWNIPNLSLLAWVYLFVSQGLLGFLMFTPIHDGAHKSVSRKRWLNELVFLGTWPIFLNSPLLFRRVHMAHHANTNGPLDPDKFTASESLAMRWAKSMLILPNYWYYAFKHYRRQSKYAAQIALTPLVPIVLFVIFALCGKAWLFILAWIGPVYLAIGILGYVNTAWPHHPATERTRVGNTRNLYVPRALQWLMGNQNLHLVHHYQPNVPWYEYRSWWRANREKLEALGAKSKSYTKRPEQF
jgi:fatty acid desaturase